MMLLIFYTYGCSFLSTPVLTTPCFLFFFLSCSIVYFFEELPQFVVKAGLVLTNMYGEDWESRLEVVKEYRFMV